MPARTSDGLGTPPGAWNGRKVIRSERRGVVWGQGGERQPDVGTDLGDVVEPQARSVVDRGDAQVGDGSRSGTEQHGRHVGDDVVDEPRAPEGCGQRRPSFEKQRLHTLRTESCKLLGERAASQLELRV